MTRLSLFVSALLVLALQAPAEARRWATAAQALGDVVPGGDTGEIVRQFDEVIYGPFVKMDESVPAMRPYLKDPSPFVRYTAARSLYVAGDRSGYATLLELVRSPEPVLVRHNFPKEVVEAAGTNEEDLRISAATVLGKYRQRASAEERKNWPIYNWIDDYVLRLNGIREGVRPERVLRGN